MADSLKLKVGKMNDINTQSTAGATSKCAFGPPPLKIKMTKVGAMPTTR